MAVSPTEAYAVGTYGVILRWNGTEWVVERPKVAGRDSLLAVTRDASGRIWAAGGNGELLVGTAN